MYRYRAIVSSLLTNDVHLWNVGLCIWGEIGVGAGVKTKIPVLGAKMKQSEIIHQAHSVTLK